MVPCAKGSAIFSLHSDPSPRLRKFRGMQTLLWLCLLLCCHFPLEAQQPPRITFSFDFPGSDPDHYVISISADGQATYDSHTKTIQGLKDDSFHFDFTISSDTLARIFNFAKRSHYFEGDVDAKKNGIASTGLKTLKYTDAQRNTQATYNYSRIPSVQDLTALLQKLSTTLEFGRRLEFDHRYQKLALDDELKRMEEMSKQDSLEELSAITPILQRIAADGTVINPVRVRAQRMIVAGRKGPP
jgi:hypothetical protein